MDFRYFKSKTFNCLLRSSPTKDQVIWNRELFYICVINTDGGCSWKCIPHRNLEYGDPACLLDSTWTSGFHAWKTTVLHPDINVYTALWATDDHIWYHSFWVKSFLPSNFKWRSGKGNSPWHVLHIFAVRNVKQLL